MKRIYTKEEGGWRREGLGREEGERKEVRRRKTGRGIRGRNDQRMPKEARRGKR